MPRRILLVEDDIAIRGCCATLMDSEGYIVDVCETMVEARRLFMANRPDLAIIDIGLPDGTGLELAAQWHGHPGPKVPIIFLTGRGDVKTRLECFQQGAQDYVHKPFSTAELLARVKVHLQVRQSHEELVKRNYELELIARARNDMTDMIVHDLKAPLTAIKGTLDLLRKHGLITRMDSDTLVSNAGSAADFMLLMLNDMLDLSQIKTTGMKMDPVDINPALLIKKLEALFAGRLRGAGVTMVSRIAPDVTTIRADQNLLYRILANLIVNAIKVSSRREPVEVDCGFHDAAVRFIVSDRGPGVRDNHKKEIFDKYVTSRKDAGIDTGTGIGLSFCHATVTAHKGRIWVEDRPGGGARFIFDIPQAP